MDICMTKSRSVYYKADLLQKKKNSISRSNRYFCFKKNIDNYIFDITGAFSLHEWQGQ